MKNLGHKLFSQQCTKKPKKRDQKPIFYDSNEIKAKWDPFKYLLEKTLHVLVIFAAFFAVTVQTNL